MPGVVPAVVIVAAADGGDAAREALASHDRIAVWVGEEGSPAFHEFAAELARSPDR